MQEFSLDDDWKFLYLPVQENQDESILKLYDQNQEQLYRVKMAKDRVDIWICLNLHSLGFRQSISVETSVTNVFTSGICVGPTWQQNSDLYQEKMRPMVHYTAHSGTVEHLIGLEHTKGMWELKYQWGLSGVRGESRFISRAYSKDLIHWQEEEEFELSEDVPAKQENDCDGSVWQGDVTDILLADERHEVALISKQDADTKSSYSTVSLPFLVEKSPDHKVAGPAAEINRLKVWKREWHNEPLKEVFCQELRFSVQPDEWPHIKLVSAAKTPDDIKGNSFLIEFLIDVGQEYDLQFQICHLPMSWEARTQMLQVHDYKIKVPLKRGKIRFSMIIDKAVAEIYTEQNILVIADVQPDKELKRVGNILTGNMFFDMEVQAENAIHISAPAGTAQIEELFVYGLRGIHLSSDSRELVRGLPEKQKILFQNENFTIYEHKIIDQAYGEPPAYVPNAKTVISPPRVMEEFCWRNTPWGDMTRTINRSDIWRFKEKQPQGLSVTTNIPVIDAAVRIALDVFQDCSSGQFALADQEQMWSAGLFQGKGEGFGVWVRDTTHTAIRSGLFLDPDTAKRSLMYAAENGFNNGADGLAMTVTGIWEYYLVTGDSKLVYDTWHILKEAIQEASTRYDEQMGLIEAGQATANDAFEEPECAGFSLGTEIYFAYAFDGMAKLGKIVSENTQLVDEWTQMGERLKENIRTLYWNDAYGYFTAGPKGSEAYEKGYWESSGQEAAIWSKFQIATEGQQRSVLRQLRKVALNDYGIENYPYRQEKNHYCHANWVVWSAGFTNTAALLKDQELLFTLICQQVRNAVFNKTFYEVIDAETGRTWRWPGQLWHAAGFLSYFTYGVLGLQVYDDYLTLSPCVPEQLEGMVIEHFRYGSAKYRIEIHGSGTNSRVLLDNTPVSKIERDISGPHVIDIIF